MRSLQLIVLTSLGAWLTVRAAETPAWVAESNVAADPALEYVGRYSPEFASLIGVEKYDDEITDLKPGVFERTQRDGEKLLAELKKRSAGERNSKVRQDIEIVIASIGERLESIKLWHELMLPYVDVAKEVFEGLHALLDERNSPERQAHAIKRLKKYAGMEPAEEPFTKLAQARTAERFNHPELVGPYIEEVRKNLDSTERYIAGLADLFKAAEAKGWEEAHDRLASQLREYNAWLKREVMPRARKGNRLPEAIYADNLKTYGVRMPPRELMERARFGFLETRDEMQAIARQIARERGLPSADYRDVLRELKKAQISGEKVLPFYKDRLAAVEQLIREHDIITLPDRKANIRLASDAESSAQPAPHMSPPRLLGNQGEYGEFVLPLTNPTADSGALQDDFTNDPFAWTLVAHEARPGHELQFAAMVEKGISVPRVVFAFNSANVEGWALYAEAVMKQYIPLDGQLFSLQARLQRAARAFLDPMLNLGEMEPAPAKQFLMREVGLSEPFATQEVDRYTFRAPGQATSYYYGYLKLRELRARTELALGKEFEEKRFHDFVLGEGLVPPEVLAKAVMDEFVPQYE